MLHAESDQNSCGRTDRGRARARHLRVVAVAPPGAGARSRPPCKRASRWWWRRARCRRAKPSPSTMCACSRCRSIRTARSPTPRNWPGACRTRRSAWTRRCWKRNCPRDSPSASSRASVRWLCASTKATRSATACGRAISSTCFSRSSAMAASAATPKSSRTQARLLMSKVRVLAFGNATASSDNAGDPNGMVRTAVLAVPVADVDRLTLAESAGRLIFALRNPKDAEVIDQSVLPVYPGVLKTAAHAGASRAAAGLDARRSRRGARRVVGHRQRVARAPPRGRRCRICRCRRRAWRAIRGQYKERYRSDTGWARRNGRLVSGFRERAASRVQ